MARVTGLLICLLLCSSSVQSVGIPIIDTSNLYQRVKNYLNFIDQSYKRIIYHQAKQELKKRLLKLTIKKSDSQAASLVKGLSEAKIKTANHEIAMAFSGVKNACEIEALSRSLAEMRDAKPRPLSDQEKDKIKKLKTNFTDEQFSDTSYKELLDWLPARKIAQVSQSEFYLNELSTALRAELIRYIKQQNKGYREKINKSFLYFVQNTVLLAIKGNTSTQKRYLLIQRSMRAHNDYYAYRISKNNGLLKALRLQLNIEQKIH